MSVRFVDDCSAGWHLALPSNSDSWALFVKRPFETTGQLGGLLKHSSRAFTLFVNCWTEPN